MLFNREIWKHYGLPRSGTNYLKRILETNYQVKVLTNEHGWKHGYYIPEFKSVAVYKDIFSWLWSIHQHLGKMSDLVPQDYCHLSFKEFIRSPIKLKRWFWNNDPLPHIPETHEAETPIKYWQQMNLHWSAHMPIIKYEELITDPIQCLNKLGLKRKKNWKECKFTTQPGDRVSNQVFDKTWYLEKKYLLNYSPEDLEHVANKL